ncbi:B-cell lymphoma 3 protein homolog [Carcharodon carcharias]|uniref:B-cell lymphoma 3 protein homolog n=1 Tax=Carcharodon carcharias TaxID=13397 RepID=UPI001B7DBDB6|nr:B-cell lymphoma 3 protein homolog [Carcharodon carcharias]
MSVAGKRWVKGLIQSTGNRLPGAYNWGEDSSGASALATKGTLVAYPFPMCVNPGSVVPTERLASLRAMEQQQQQVCPAPLDLRLRRGQCQERPGVPAEWTTAGAGRGRWHQRAQEEEVEVGNPPDARAGEGGARRGPASEPAGEGGHRAPNRPRISLPPRKRPYTAEREEKPPAPSKAPCLPEESVPTRADHQEPVRLKDEPQDTFSYCGGGQQQLLANPLPSANGYPYMESIYMPYRLQVPCYTGVGKPCLPPTSFPICPVPTHPLPIGPLPAFHPGPCLQLHTQEDILASDIAMATRQDEDGDTPLHIAVVQEDGTMVEKLIQLLVLGKKDLDIYNNLRQTPLHLAVITKQSSIVRQLVANGASRVLLDRNGQTAVHLACEHSSLECLQSLLASAPERIELEIRNYDGYTPLHVAVNSHHREIVAHLLAQGADIDAADIKSGRTPLVHAVESNCMDMVNLLLEHGANVNLQTYSGNTALHSSSGRGLMEIVKVLLKNGADSSIKNCHNDTSLMVAKNRKVIDILRGKASRSVAQTLSSPRLSSVIKECPSPSSKPNSPLSANHVVRCPSPGAQQKGSPQHLLPPAALSPCQDLPSFPLSDSQMSYCQRSPLNGGATPTTTTTTSHPRTPRPASRPHPGEVPVGAQEDRGPPQHLTTQPHPWEKMDRQAEVAGSGAGSPTGTPPARRAGHCQSGHAFPQLYCHGHASHPLLPGGAVYPLSPFHQRYPTGDGAFLNFPGATHPTLVPPAFVAHLTCPLPVQPAGGKERHAPNPPPAKPSRVGWPLLLHHQGRPSSRDSDRSDVSTLSANSAGRGES